MAGHFVYTGFVADYAGAVRPSAAAELSELVALCGGVVQFDPGPTLDHLLATWGTLVKEIRGVP